MRKKRTTKVLEIHKESIRVNSDYSAAEANGGLPTPIPPPRLVDVTICLGGGGCLPANTEYSCIDPGCD